MKATGCWQAGRAGGFSMPERAGRPKSQPLSAKDFASDQEVRWCPGCGDYSILKQVRTVLPELGVATHDVVFVSGIGCAARFPYYMSTYGLHSIHGRAPAVATGLKIANPDLSIWVVTGDGDGLSIGGNHLMHMLRRNLDVNILLFNNEIYGLTKGQYSPTSRVGQVTRSTPLGALDHPVNPLAFALGVDASFVARTMDRDTAHLRQMLIRAAQHKGSSFLEIYQNCNVFNDGAFARFTDRETKPANALLLAHGRPLVFGEQNELGVRLDGTAPRVVDLTTDGYCLEDLWVHDEQDLFKATLLARFFDTTLTHSPLPRPFGVFYALDRLCYEDAVREQTSLARERKGAPDLDALLTGEDHWDVADQRPT